MKHTSKKHPTITAHYQRLALPKRPSRSSPVGCGSCVSTPADEIIITYKRIRPSWFNLGRPAVRLRAGRRSLCEGVISDVRERGLIIEEMDEHNIRAAIDRHWAASAAGDQVGEHEIYHDDAVCEYPQSGEIIYGRQNLQALRSHHPDKPSEFTVRRIVGEGNVWVSEYEINYGGKRLFTVSVMEFRDGKVSHETQYFADSFDAPAWRAQWVGRTT